MDDIGGGGGNGANAININHHMYENESSTISTITSSINTINTITPANNNNTTNANNNNNQMINSEQQLDNLSNLLINSFEDDTAVLDKYESEMDRNINENLIIEKEHANQRLFQSFQTSACAVAQMFKDKTTSQQSSQQPQSSVLSAWESFQNSAGAITVLYKGILFCCYFNLIK